MVEGQSRPSFRENPGHNGFDIPKHIACRYTHRRDPGFGQPGIPYGVPFGAIAISMDLPIDLDRQPAIAAKEIEHIGPARVLPSELEASGPFPERLPQQDFRQAHLTAQSPCLACRPRTSFRRYISQHSHSPSTMLRRVPFPEQARGGFQARHPTC